MLELAILPNNKIDGYFITAVASKECQQVIGKKHPIIGYWTGNAITFSVVYDQCGSVYSVTGNFDKEQNNIDVIVGLKICCANGRLIKLYPIQRNISRFKTIANKPLRGDVVEVYRSQ